MEEGQKFRSWQGACELYPIRQLPGNATLRLFSFRYPKFSGKVLLKCQAEFPTQHKKLKKGWKVMHPNLGHDGSQKMVPCTTSILVIVLISEKFPQ